MTCGDADDTCRYPARSPGRHVQQRGSGRGRRRVAGVGGRRGRPGAARGPGGADPGRLVPARRPHAPAAEDLPALMARQSQRLRQLETLIEAAPVGTGLVQLDGRTPLTNDTLRQLLGYSTEEFATMPFADYTVPE